MRGEPAARQTGRSVERACIPGGGGFIEMHTREQQGGFSGRVDNTPTEY